MRVLLDECVPKRLRRELLEHDVVTVVEMGWSGVTNGKLLALAATEFDCFPTVDANIEKQQNLSSLPISVLLVRAVRYDLNTLQTLAPQILEALVELKPLQFHAIGA
jgi:predicted nuclease of predicted toxin-antitoxin system